MPATATLPPPARPALPGDTAGLEDAIQHGLRLVARAEAFAASLGVPDPGDFVLPPALESPADQASLAAIAPLYLAAEVEVVGLIEAAEQAAGLFASGALTPASAQASKKLAALWRGRRERFSAAERRAFFTRLFGGEESPSLAGEGGSNGTFTTLMIDLTEAIYQWEGSPLWGGTPGAREETRVRLTARMMAANLLPRSRGMTPFAAREILGAMQAALEIFKEVEVQRFFGAPTLWGAVEQSFQRYHGRTPDVPSHLGRARAGQAVLAWLAEVLPQLETTSTPVLTRGHPVITAAAAWMQASLAIVESTGGA